MTSGRNLDGCQPQTCQACAHRVHADLRIQEDVRIELSDCADPLLPLLESTEEACRLCFRNRSIRVGYASRMEQMDFDAAAIQLRNPASDLRSPDGMVVEVGGGYRDANRSAGDRTT